MDKLSNAKDNQSLQKSETTELAKVLLLSKLARTSNQELLGDEDWIFLAETLQKDFEDISLDRAKVIIMSGIKGRFGDERQPLNFTKIYQWFKQTLQTGH